MNDNKYFSTIEEFIKETPAKKMMLSALKELLPINQNKFAFFFSIILAIIFSVWIGISDSTVEFSLKITEIFMNTLLALFGCIFSVYSILLAFLSDSYIKKLSLINYKEKCSFLTNSTTYYESVLFLYFIAIGITGLLLIALNCMDYTFFLTKNHIFNNVLAIILLVLYFSFLLRVFYELKSTIYNTIVLFRASIAYKLLKFAKDNEEKENNSDN